MALLRRVLRGAGRVAGTMTWRQSPRDSTLSFSVMTPHRKIAAYHGELTTAKMYEANLAFAVG